MTARPDMTARYRPGMTEAELQAADRISTAVHEAGHAVAAELLFQNLVSVTIDPPRPHCKTGPATAAQVAQAFGKTPAVPPRDLPDDPRAEYGHVSAKSGQAPNYFQALRRNAIYCLAGAAAQEHKSDDEDWTLDEPMEVLSPTDLEALWVNINATEGTDHERADLAKIWSRDARVFVQKHWQAIERVAKALLERGTLDSEDVYELVEVTE